MTTQFYNSIGPRYYDLFDSIFRWGRKGNPREGLPPRLPEGPLQILDLCVGTAATSLWVAQARPDSRVEGIDLSEGMLSRARDRIAQAGLKNLTVRAMDARRTSFGAGTFDVVMSSFALHEMAPALQGEILAEAQRVLRPEGKIYLIDFGMQPDWRTKAFLAFWGIFEPRGFSKYVRRDWPTWLAGQGLRAVEVIPYSFSYLIVVERQ
jgi:demethylmenaquinone methyltransferase/2-methoxy-6-polyprenyl-1,4-benzoquinol methylase